VRAGLRCGKARPGADGVVTDGAALSGSDRRTEPGLPRRLPGITAVSALPELLSVITLGIQEWLLTSELPLALDWSAARLPRLLRETVGMVLRGMPAPTAGHPDRVTGH